MISIRGVLVPLAALVLGGCTANLSRVQEPGRAVAFPTAIPWTSMVYAARTDSGVVVVDLGWRGASAELRRRLARMGARPEDVTDVFLTHTHRDHIGAWRSVRGARFHVHVDEVALLEGQTRHPDLLSRAAQVAFGEAGPWPGEVKVRPFSRDTLFTFGRDTVRAFAVPGHTAGSAAYLLRGVLFLGDAVARKPVIGWTGADPLFTADPRRGRESLRALLERVQPYGARFVCNAHAKCAPLDSAFVRKVTR